MRKIIQLSSAVSEEGLFLHALYDDGTVWINESASSQGRWSRVPSIPQDEPAKKTPASRLNLFPASATNTRVTTS